MSERPKLQKHHSSSSVLALGGRSPGQRLQHVAGQGRGSRLGARVPSYARNVNKMHGQKAVLPRNKSRTTLRMNKSETALHKRNRSANELVMTRGGEGADAPNPDEPMPDDSREQDVEELVEDDNVDEGGPDEGDRGGVGGGGGGAGASGGASERRDEQSTKGQGYDQASDDQDRADDTPHNPPPSSPTQTHRKASDQHHPDEQKQDTHLSKPDSQSKVASDDMERVPKSLFDHPITKYRVGNRMVDLDRQTGSIALDLAHISATPANTPTATRSSTPNPAAVTPSFEFHQEIMTEPTPKPNTPEVSFTAEASEKGKENVQPMYRQWTRTNLQANLDRDRAREMQPVYAYPPSLWRDSTMRNVIPHLKHPEGEVMDPYNEKYYNRMNRIVTRKLENIKPVADPLLLSLERLKVDPVSHLPKKPAPKKPAKSALNLMSWFGLRKKTPLVPEGPSEYDLRVKAFKADFARLERADPWFAAELRHMVLDQQEEEEEETSTIVEE